jgi:hypothetical protein
MKTLPITIVLAIASMAFVRGSELATTQPSRTVIVQVYQCPRCDRLESYAEDSAHIHNCSGTAEKPHARVAMIHKGKRADSLR